MSVWGKNSSGGCRRKRTQMMLLQTLISLCRFEKGPCQRATLEMSLQADLWSRETILAEGPMAASSILHKFSVWLHQPQTLLDIYSDLEPQFEAHPKITAEPSSFMSTRLLWNLLSLHWTLDKNDLGFLCHRNIGIIHFNH